MSEDTEIKTEPVRAGMNGNLILPQKGEVRNPKGKPKGTRNRSTIVREMVEAAAAEALKGKIDLGLNPATIFEQLVATQIVKASLGDTMAFKELADSAFGKLTDNVNTTHNFKKMGDVMVQPVGEGSGAQEPFALTFEIGEDAVPIETSDEEGESNE